MALTEGEGSSEMDLTEIETTAEFLDGSVIFHLVKDAIGFVLYMHQQIPSILQDISLEFESMHAEYKELEMDLAKTEVKASLRRKHVGRMRECKQGIRRMEKFMNSVSCLQTALQLMISEIPNIQEVILVLGTSPIRPQHVYQMYFSHSNAAPSVEADFIKGKTAEGLSKKAIRALISRGAGSSSYPGPTKLFLMVKAPTSFNLPLHFLPKRDFRYSKKIVPFRLRFRCRTQGLEIDASGHGSLSSRSTGLINSSSSDFIWFQCRHAIKGIAFKTPEEG
ncbi:F15k9.21, putative isoform 1 [Theobroma cacao]|nr:F15k9.21, putative isoform 1 [Theobroma cacao]